MMFLLESVDKNRALGEFQEKEFGKYFEYATAESESWGDTFGFPFKIAVGPLGETRYAKIYKTVAYVAVDQDENGDPVIEKWNIKNHRIWER